MNTILEELAKQADEYLLENVQEENRSSWAQVFAELIVTECIEQVITGPNGPAHYAVEAALRLKKHFGVEE